MNILKLLDEAARDDQTKYGSSTRVALLTATAFLTIGLLYAETMFAIGLAYGLQGVEGWVTIINHLAVCLATVLTGYATKLIACAIKGNPPPEANQ